MRILILLPLALAACAGTPPPPQIVERACGHALRRYPHPIAEVQPARARQWLAGHNAAHDATCGTQRTP